MSGGGGPPGIHMIEQEIKLRFDNPEAARHAVRSAGGRLVHSRRLIDDRLFDTARHDLQSADRALRVRRDAATTFVTFKGAPLPGAFKTREEIETTAGDAGAIESILRHVGFDPWWRAQKFREEYVIAAAKIAVDETPMGTFVEIEGADVDIARLAGAFGRAPRDYIVVPYRRLFVEWCEARGLEAGDMLFEPTR
jgi:adenylate cyclase class 2